MKPANKNFKDLHLSKTKKKILRKDGASGKASILRANHRSVTPLLPLENYSKGFSWPSKIAFVLDTIKQGSVDEVTAEIIELEGLASQEGVAEVNVTVSEFLDKLSRIGKIACKTLSGNKVYFLIPHMGKRARIAAKA
jgi:hypothetical protein